METIVEFISNDLKIPPPPPPAPPEHDFAFQPLAPQVTANGETLHVGYMSLLDLHGIYIAMGLKFLDRNIRAGLSAEKPPNRALRKSFEEIVLKKSQAPDTFVFNHNGVTLAVESLELRDEKAFVTQPRLLNGAQTVTSLARFLKDNERNKSLASGWELLQSVRVLTKIISRADANFVTNATICNNQQNPVEPWSLRANDRIQLEFAERFKDELGIFYERQQDLFKSLLPEDLEEQGVQSKSLEIKQMAQTFLAAQGEVEKVSNLREVFSGQKIYDQTFQTRYLHCDARRIVLAYKISPRLLNRVLREMETKLSASQQFIGRARNLVWALLIQGLLNDSKLPHFLEQFGSDLVLQADFNGHLKLLGAGKVRLILVQAIKAGNYQKMIEDEKYSFLRTKALYQSCMAVAQDKYGWEKKSF